MKFYHVDRLKRLATGQVVECNKEILGLDSLLGYSKVTQHGHFYLREVVPAGTDSNGMSINGALEVFFEAIRLNSFRERPSRFQSLFAYINIDEAIALRENNANNKECPIWEVEAVEYFCADMNLLKFGLNGIDAFSNAHKYWSGDGSKQPLWEYLLVSPITVIGQYKG
ncbi:MAG: hypothetical protein CL610_05390 [Anaerolineaceae bacterium]|nr:hypothetical protein [Anaerolineaceae bacterium]